MEQIATLRATNHRLASTPVEDLPRIASFLGACIASCSASLRQPETKGSDSTVAVHRLKTRISSLLQDRTAAGRFTGAVLVKSLLGNHLAGASGNWESWARSLIACLNKPDPFEVKRIYLATLVQLFLLSQADPTLQREITTPLLPPFITASLNNVRPTTFQNGATSRTVLNPLLLPTLRCWDELMQRNGSTFRPFESRIKAIALSALSDEASPLDLREAAAQIFASLHLCAQKGTAATVWDQTFYTLIQASHSTLNHVFRAVLEEWTASDVILNINSISRDYAKEVQNLTVDLAGLGPWTGTRAGFVRAETLLTMMHGLLCCHIPSTNIPLGQIFDLLTRIFLVVVPSSSAAESQALRANTEVTRDEREELWANMPLLHTTAIKFTQFVVEQFGRKALPLLQNLTDMILDVFNAENRHAAIRAQAYAAVKVLLVQAGNSCSNFNKSSVFAISRACCRDLGQLLVDGHQDTNTHGKVNGVISQASVTSNALPSKLGKPGQTEVLMTIPTKVTNEATALLPALLEFSAPLGFPQSLRAELDRIAVLSGHEHAMFSSIMNPVTSAPGQLKTASIVPFLARIAGDKPGFEALFRPRAPVQVQPVNEARHLENGLRSDSDEENIDAVVEVDEDRDKSIADVSPVPEPQDATMINVTAIDTIEASQELERRPLAAKRDLASMKESENGYDSSEHLGHGSETKRVRIVERPAEEEVLRDSLGDEAQTKQEELFMRTLPARPDAKLAVDLNQSITGKSVPTSLDDSDSDSDGIPEINMGSDTDEAQSEIEDNNEV